MYNVLETVYDVAMTTNMETTSQLVNFEFRERRDKPRIYVWPSNETILENLFNRHNRPRELFKAAALQEMEKLGLEGQLRWSSKAGCSCGCSPGFVVSGDRGFNRRDLHVSLTEISE